MNNKSITHPGQVLMEDFLIPLGITAYKLSKEIGIPQNRISEIIKGKRRITTDTALRFSKFFGNSAKFWLGLQDDYDIASEQIAKRQELNLIRHYKSLIEDKNLSGNTSQINS